MISLLAAVFGKDHLPPFVRYGLLAVGIAGLIYRLRKLAVEHKDDPEIKITVKPASPIVKAEQPASLGYLR